MKPIDLWNICIITKLDLAISQIFFLQKIQIKLSKNIIFSLKKKQIIKSIKNFIRKIKYFLL